MVAITRQDGLAPRSAASESAVSARAFIGGQDGSNTMPVYPGSTILPPGQALRKLIWCVEKQHIIHIVLSWIHAAQCSASPELLPPQLSRRGPRQMIAGRETGGITREDEDDATASFVDLYEERRARSYEELELLWCEHISDFQWGRVKIVERILEVDWPQGLTFAMTATFAFEAVRANRLGRIWYAVCLDYGDDADIKAMLGKDGGAGSSRHKMYESVTPVQLKERFSAELRNFCTHAMFLDAPVKAAKVHSKMFDAISPLPDDWTKPFTHIRVVNCYTPGDVCAPGLHILHIPRSPWFLVSGMMGRQFSDAKDMALAALAHSLGARRMRQPTKGDMKGAWRGKLAELRGRDPLGLREILLSEGMVRDRDVLAGGIPGGKGRAMRRGEAEDGPLVRPEKRKREDKTGLYEDVESREKGESTEMLEPEPGRKFQHPAERRWAVRQRKTEIRRRRREMEDLFGRTEAVNAVASNEDLPRVQQVKFELHLPFPNVPGYGQIPDQIMRMHPVQLRLDGTHVLAGLRTLVEAGLDRPPTTAPSTEDGKKVTQRPKQNLDAHGLPSWLVEVRGTKVRVGLGDKDKRLDSSSEDGEDE